MNSSFWSLTVRYFLEFFSMVPCAVLCFLPVQNRLRRKPLILFSSGSRSRSSGLSQAD